MKKECSLICIYLITIIAMLFWSIAFIWMKQLFDIGFRPITVVFFRLIVASLFMIIICKILKKNDIIDKKDYKFLFLLAFAEPFCYFLGEGFGMLYVTPTVASTMVALIPLLTPIFAWFMVRERANLFQIIGLIVSFFGVLILVVDDLNLGGKLIGFLLMGIAVLSGTMFGIFLKKLVNKYSAFTITKYQTIIGMFLFMPLFFIFELEQFKSIPFRISDYQNIIYLGALCSSLAFVILAQTVRSIGVVRMNIFTNLIPVFTAILAYFFYPDEGFTRAKIAAIVVVILGLFVSQLNKIKYFVKKDNKKCIMN